MVHEFKNIERWKTFCSDCSCVEAMNGGSRSSARKISLFQLERWYCSPKWRKNLNGGFSWFYEDNELCFGRRNAKPIGGQQFVDMVE